MEGLFRLSEEQLERIKPFFPNSGGVSRVDGRKVLSGIIDVQRRVDAPAAHGPYKTLYNRFRRFSQEGSLPVDLLPMSPMRRHRAGSQCRDRSWCRARRGADGG